MAAYQEQKEDKKELNKSLSDTKKKNPEQKSEKCPNCGNSVSEGENFCSECGHDFIFVAFCPNCGANTVPGADICENCKAWLLDGHCKFCYAQIDPHSEFCSECGNPREGIRCPNCGSLSIFDFCITCGNPLTEGAQAALEFAKTDPEARLMAEAVQEAAAIEEELIKLESVIKGDPETAGISLTDAEVKKEALDIAKKTEKDKRLTEEEARKEAMQIARGQAASNRRIESAAKNETRQIAGKQAEEKRRAEIRAAMERKAELERKKREAIAAAEAARKNFKTRTFITKQEARRFHNAIKPKTVRGWRCNAYNVLHPDGPNGCADPNRGGAWE